LRAEGGGVRAGEAEVEAGVDPGVFHLLDGEVKVVKSRWAPGSPAEVTVKVVALP